MAKDSQSEKLAVIVHADVADSTRLVQQDERLAHELFQQAFNRFREHINRFRGRVLELRGDALVAEFELASDAVSATLSFQNDQAEIVSGLDGEVKPEIRVGIALGEVVIADNTVTGAGVVLAQRVEQLSNAGGVCISSAVHEALPKRMPFVLENLGEHELKGFDDPVRVYRVKLSPDAPIPPHSQERNSKFPKRTWQLKATIALVLVAMLGLAVYLSIQHPFEPDIPLPDKPSIAVLPFTNLSDERQQEYFADGMTENLITDLSKLSGLFVIARNSVFTYKGKSVRVRQVAEELGVRYVLEGSIQKSGKRIRVNAQLIDATTAGHLWAERYDGSLDDVFSMQDKITRSIVNALSLALTGRDQDKLAQIETHNSDAYDAFLRGWERYRQGTPADLAKAVSHFNLAIELDPDYTRAHSALAAVYWSINLNGWSRSLGLNPFQVREKGRLALEKATKQPVALTYQVTSERATYFKRKPDKALAEAELAIDLDANDPAGHLAMAAALIKAKRAAEAVEAVYTAMRLDPHYPASYLSLLGQAQYVMGHYENAAVSLKDASIRNPDDEWAFIYLAAALGQLEQSDNAQHAIESANKLRARSGWGALTIETVSDHRATGGRRYYFKWFGDYKDLRDGLRKAGLKPRVSWGHLITTGDSGTEVEGATTIDAKTAKKLHERGVPFIDADIKWLQKRIPGTHWLSWWRHHFNEVLLAQIVNKNQEVVIYSSDERWAPQAAARAVTWGYKKVYFFPYGMVRWEAEGYPVDNENKG